MVGELSRKPREFFGPRTVPVRSGFSGAQTPGVFDAASAFRRAADGNRPRSAILVASLREEMRGWKCSFGHGVVPAIAPGLTTTNASQGQPDSAACAVLVERFERVLRTARGEAATP